jgi:hypothetical protein
VLIFIQHLTQSLKTQADIEAAMLVNSEEQDFKKTENFKKFKQLKKEPSLKNLFYPNWEQAIRVEQV